MRLVLPTLCTIAALGLSACAPGLPDPAVTSVFETWAYNGETTEILITGEYFYPRVELDVREAGGRLDRQFSVHLDRDSESYALEGVELGDYQHLTAFVPEGLPKGLYTLVVTTPLDQSARLPRGFTITDTRADRFDVSTDGAAFLVEDDFQVQLNLQDPGGDLLLQAIDVVLDVTSTDGIESTDLTIDASHFDEAQQSEIDGGYRVALTLRAGEESQNSVTLTGHIPKGLSVTLSPAEEDSVVEPDTKEIEITPASLNTVELLLPHSGYSTTAGDPFDIDLRLVDGFGNLIDYATATLVLYEECGSASQAVEFRGETEVEFTAIGATSHDCPENRVLASGTVSGSSDAFEVLPDDAIEYDVSVFPSTIIAGDQMALITVRALDSYGNQVTDYGVEWLEEQGKELQIQLVDELGGLDEENQGHGNQECPGFEDGYQICQAWLTKAGSPDQLTATGDDGLQGKSEAFDVVASDLADFDLDHGTPPFTAGLSFDFFVRPTDAWGNTVAIDPTVDPFSLEGTPHEISCETPNTTTIAGEWSYPCTATTVESEQFIAVGYPLDAPTVTRQLDEGFQVQNGALGLAVFARSPGALQEAGQSFSLEIELFDAYGNPYIVQSTTTVTLEDCTGSLDPVSLGFDAAGFADTSATITQAATGCTITALDGSTTLGSTAVFDISAGELDSLQVMTQAPWVFVGDDFDVELRAVDAYGNTVLNFEETVTLDSNLGSFDSLSVDSFTDGIAWVQPDFDHAVIADTLLAETGSGIVVTSPLLDVLDSGCGVEAVLLVDGDDEPVMCLTTGVVTSTLDASRSTGSPTLFHFDDGAGKFERLSTTTTTTTWSAQAAYLVSAVAFDGSACGSIDQVIAYVAEPDGEPAGPVEVTPVDSVRVVGSSTDGATQVDFQAFDCARDVAAYGTLYVRTTLGDISGATASGQGLALVLDSAGQGQVTWSVASELNGGDSSVVAGREGSVAIGSATITAVGDDALPTVLELDPVGASSEITDTLTVRFDDAMREATLDSANIVFSDSLGPLTFDSITMDASGTLATMTLEADVDLAADVYTLVLSDQIRDDAGNRLDGDRDGLASSFTVQMGGVGDLAPDLVSCTPDTNTIRPDGDDQPATDEADMVEVTLTANAGADHWLLEVYDSASFERGRFWQIAGTAGPDTMLWDARDQMGSILPNGVYTLVFSAADAALDLGTSCQIDLLIDNTVVEVP